MVLLRCRSKSSPRRRSREFVGAGRLEVEHGESEPTYLYYSNSLGPKFAEVAEAIKQLIKGRGADPANRDGALSV